MSFKAAFQQIICGACDPLFHLFDDSMGNDSSLPTTQDYESAVSCLLSELHMASSPDAIKMTSARRTETLHDMRIYLRRLGLDLNGDIGISNKNDNSNETAEVVEEATTADLHEIIRSEIIDLCQKIDSPKTPDELLESYEGREEELLESLRTFVFRQMSDEEKKSIRVEIISLVLVLDLPKNVKDLLVQYGGREDVLLRSLIKMKKEKDRIITEIRTLVEESGLDNDACTELLQKYPGQEVELLGYLNERFATIKAENDYTVPPLILHVTGTKGKGSTLAMCESIMRNAYGLNTGMFTSPHLVDIRERIRMNGKLVSKEVFGRAYWTIRLRLEEAAKSDIDNANGDVPTMPGYFRMLTLMSLHIFCTSQSPRIDVILLESGMGGRYDATNVVEPIVPRRDHTRHGRLLVRGVTVIDYDHVQVLGSRLEQIAWEKGGIYIRNKSMFIGSDDGGYDAFTTNAGDESNEEVRQPPEGEEMNDVVFANGNNSLHVLKVLNRIAVENGSCLDIVTADDDSKFDNIGLKCAQKKNNAALALAMCQYAAEKCRLELSHDGSGVPSALAESFWPGRWHTVPLPDPTQNDDNGPRVTLRCDGAHTPISMEACTRWFREVTTISNDEDGSPLIVKRVLVFNCSHERNPIPLLYSLCKSDMFDSVYFCHADCERPSATPKELEDGWTREHLPLDDDSGGMVTITWEEMLEALSKLKNGGVKLPTKPSGTTWQVTLGYLWSVMEAYHRRDGDGPLRPVTIGLSVKEALASIKDEDSESRIEVCVTGSLYVVGSALAAAGWEE